MKQLSGTDMTRIVYERYKNHPNMWFVTDVEGGPGTYVTAQLLEVLKTNDDGQMYVRWGVNRTRSDKWALKYLTFRERKDCIEGYLSCVIGHREEDGTFVDIWDWQEYHDFKESRDVST